MTDDREVLSALIDREPVDPDALTLALEDPASRALLVDFVRLRALAQADEAGLPQWAPRLFPTSRTWVQSAWLRAAVVLLVLAVGAGGGAWLERYVSRERPPEPDRVVQFEPVPVVPASVRTR
jgi:hypothetical protein